MMINTFTASQGKLKLDTVIGSQCPTGPLLGCLIFLLALSLELLVTKALTAATSIPI